MQTKLIGGGLIVFGVVLAPLVLVWSLAFGVPGASLMAPELAPRVESPSPKAGDPVSLSDLPDDIRLQVLAQEKAAGEEKARPVITLIVLALSLGSVASGVLILLLRRASKE